MMMMLMMMVILMTAALLKPQMVLFVDGDGDWHTLLPGLRWERLSHGPGGR